MRSLAFAGLCAVACASATAEQQREAARSVEPARLQPTRIGTFPVSKARVRAYADETYRAQNPQWERKLAAHLRDINQLLEPTLGLSLELAESLPWERKAESSDMAAMLGELSMLDPASDVDFVIGLVDALPSVSTSMHQLGAARPLGRHLLVRGMNDTKEAALLDAALDTLSASERRQLFASRKKHKEQVVLLHELGHALGAMHGGETNRIEFPAYDHSQSSFAAPDVQLMRTVVKARFQDRAPIDAVAAALLRYLEASDNSAWDSDERERLITELEASAAGSAPIAPEMELGAGVRPSDREAYARAIDLAEGGAYHEAWEQAEPLVDYYPDEPALQILACRLAMNLEGGVEAAIERCRRASALVPDDPEPELFIATSLVTAGKRDDAIAALAGVEKRLAKPSPRGAARKTQWGKLATAYQSLGVVSGAERAAIAAKSDAVLTWAGQTRARFALPPDGAPHSITPALEQDYVEAIKKLLQHVYAREFPKAEAAARAIERKYPGAPGVPVALCDLEIRRRKFDRARKHCARALSAYEGASWAHYLTGLLDKRDAKLDAAITELRRAIELDPQLRHGYQVLGQIYAASGKTAERTALAESYHKTFGQPLE